MSGDHKVGYGKPPAETRFKPGHSGNPRGRPKGSKNYKTILMERMRERVQPEPMAWRRPRMKHYIEKLVDRAIAGEWAALKQVLTLMKEHDTLPEVRRPVHHSVDIASIFPPMRPPLPQKSGDFSDE